MAATAPPPSSTTTRRSRPCRCWTMTARREWAPPSAAHLTMRCALELLLLHGYEPFAYELFASAVLVVQEESVHGACCSLMQNAVALCALLCFHSITAGNAWSCPGTLVGLHEHGFGFGPTYQSPHSSHIEQYLIAIKSGYISMHMCTIHYCASSHASFCSSSQFRFALACP